MSHNAKVFVGISGGVDSSVAAYLLKEQGYEVEGVFMKNWEGDDEDGYCAAEQDLADAQAVCSRLNIPLHSVNFATEYWDRVFSHFLSEYKAGRTPNPDILCNKEIKFNAFLNYAMNAGADLIATGHYVKKGLGTEGDTLLKGNDRNKDQSYFLYAIAQDALAKSLFPVGELAKDKVREIAKDQRLVTHDKKDSTGICFIGERKFKKFLSEFLLAQPGVIESAEGEVIGEHQGLMYYTYGQRQGLGIGGLKQADDAPWFVVDKDIERNALIVGQGANHPLLFSQGLICDQADWISGHTPEMPLQCTAKTRYRQLDQHCLVQQQDDGTFCVMFSSAQRAITPGQSVVFYHHNSCLGGAIIRDFIR